MSPRTDVVVAGHLCLDVIPSIPTPDTLRFEPGALKVIDRVNISTGGCVPNTGIALHRLGVGVRLVGKVGPDPFGAILSQLLKDVDPGLANHLIVSDRDGTSYSIIASTPSTDRMILHSPGANHTFRSADVPRHLLAGARILHLGYLTLLRAMYQESGAESKRLLTWAKREGLATSLDTAYPGPGTERVNWKTTLREVLPLVDFFLPSYHELCLMLDARLPPEPTKGESVRQIASHVLALGARAVGIKLGEGGFYFRSTEIDSRLEPSLGISTSDWKDRELWSAAYSVEVRGTTGAGDAAVAGFLAALLHGMNPEEAVNAACAAGACCVEGEDASSGILSWEATNARQRDGWTRMAVRLGSEWKELHPGVWVGPGDKTASKREERRP